MISTVERVLFLKRVELFAQIPGQELARVAKVAEELEIRAGAELMREGDMGDSLYLLLSGEVEVRRGDRQVVKLGPPECVGELALLDSEPRSATVRATEPTRVLKLERDAFYELMNDHLEITQGVIKVLTHRLRQTTAQSDLPG
ncbi:MAG: cyclic nucleotide-binding domain-containing protein [Myxococcota bacterium]